MAWKGLPVAVSDGRRSHILWRATKGIFNRPALPALSPYESLLTIAFTEKKPQGIEKIKPGPALQRQGGRWSGAAVPVLCGQCQQW